MTRTLWGGQSQLATPSENHPGNENSVAERVGPIATGNNKLPYFKYEVTLQGLYISISGCFGRKKSVEDGSSVSDLDKEETEYDDSGTGSQIDVGKTGPDFSRFDQ
ncbi:hypothetical protein AVEN_193828-1 [Araneus ventricosus]|uniref:Uncharacterized protein n=1 Tax=Araneus ventricosus TaxID=182803 RepID=A0A4Y2PKP5_ARAVE|nr:hypothetical protein AVEN_193828-1 [Araneus ventricosus]